ncbi:MAG: fibronectin type III domain-containing protein [Thermoanaerobaculia bacterium]
MKAKRLQVNMRKHLSRRNLTLCAVFLALLIAGVPQAANVVTDADMEAAGTGSWPITNTTGTSSCAKATDHSAAGQSLKCTSPTGARINYDWYNQQSLGTINAGDAVTWSAWWGGQFVAAAGTATMTVELVKPDGAVATIWTNATTLTTTFQSGNIAAADISSQITATGTYAIRLHVSGKTANNSGASTAAWWDNVIVDVIPKVITLADGADPAASSRCPGDPPALADSFTLQTNTGTATVTAGTVTLATGTWPGISLVEVTNDAGSTVYGSATPAGDTVAINFSPTALPVDTTSTQFRIRVTPKSHLAMPAPPGATYPVTAKMTSLTSTTQVTGTDNAGTTITIDNASPSNAAWGTNVAGNSTVTLNWTNPADADFSGVVILRNSVTPITDAPQEGVTYTSGTIGSSTVVYGGPAQTTSDNTVTNGTTYYYKIFARDTCGNYSTGVESGPLTPSNAVPALTTGTATATVDSCNQISVSATFTGDSGTSNSSATFERATAIGGPYTAVCSNVTTASPRSCAFSGLTANTTYYFRVTFTDPDGVSGQNPQIAGPYTTPVCPAPSPTTAGTATAQVSSCNELTVTAPFTGDGNANGSVKVEYNTTNTWPGTTSCASVVGGAPRMCLVTGLTASTAYYVRVTYSDPDGVTGTSPQVIGPLTTTACGADTVPPMVLVLSPAVDAVIGGTDRAKVQVWDAGGLAGTNPVQWSIDGAAVSATGVVVNTNYSCGTGCAVYEFDVATSALANGPHYLTVQATDAAGNVAHSSIPVIVNTSGTTPKGAGNLLRRTFGSQICIDCHALATHSSQMTSTTYGNWSVPCVTCHTPHDTTNVELIRTSLVTPNSGAAAVTFQSIDKATLTNPQNSFLGAFDATGAPFNDGVCEVCHTKTTHYRNDASGGDHTHNASIACIKCHEHTRGFIGGGGDCRGCHGTTSQNGRRAVDADFGLQSHHAGNGGTMGGTLTNFDCVVCHAEGTVTAGQTDSTSYHINGIIDLRDADNSATVYSYDKNAVSTSAGAAANWNSSNAVWRTQTSTALDPFCLSCHDSSGALTATTFGETGAAAQNPFNDTAITNNYDQMTRPSITDIKSKVSGAPPAQGTFARHAIRGQSASIYTKYTALGGTYKSIYEFGGFTTMGTDEAGKPNWNDTSVMGCADCHTSDGANGTSGNAHGSNSEYLLKDASGTATEGSLSGSSYICYRCHVSTSYVGSSDHTGNSSDFNDSVTQVGTARMTAATPKAKGTMFGIACMNCHGGAPGNNDGTNGYGWIHGTNQVFNNGAGGTRNAYRFTNGGALRYYDPGTWATASATCYTLANADSWSACTQHSGGTGHTRAFTRPLSY